MVKVKPVKKRFLRRNVFTVIQEEEGKVDLVYVNNRQSGITRKKKGRKFFYYSEKKEIKDERELERIRRLAIPPAWKKVWICPFPNGHLQATGIDAKNRKQYRYHELWNQQRNKTKFHRLFAFGKTLPAIRRKVRKDLSLPGLPEEKVLATVISLMERTNIRIGNTLYEKLYGSYGLTTFKDRHVKVEGDRMRFDFKGKKGIYHSIAVKNKTLARIVRKCRDIPGKELFQYITKEGDHRTIDSGMVNNYIKTISGKEFSAKDFRTWTGTVHAFHFLRKLDKNKPGLLTRKKIVQAMDEVSKELGNSRTICKKYYVHPVIISLCENNCIQKYSRESNGIRMPGLTCEEKLLMKILKKEKETNN
ncbi:MAG: DNA topoisomerase IB [Bacteroidia bacterium]